MKRFSLYVLVVLTLLIASCAPTRVPQPLIWNVGSLPELQAAMIYARPGAMIVVRAGTYNGGPLIISVSGTAEQPITLKCETPLACTINSGDARSLITSGNRGWWIIEGFRFISTMAVGSGAPEQSTVNFGYDFWGDGDTAERGNDGFILRNCYIEGTVYFYGSDNLVENCELNGKRLSNNGLSERGKPSDRNTFRNNIIHDYLQRGGWSLRGTSDTLWEGNTIYDIAVASRGNGIDCDGASVPVTNCRVKNNVIYNIGGEAGVLLENAFGSIVEENVIHHASVGVSLINYGVESDHATDGGIEYRDDAANIIIRNNVIHSTSDGILCKGVRSGQITNNTIHGTTQTPGYWAAIALAQYKGWYCPQWVITGNIVSQPAHTAIWLEGDSGNGTTINDNFYAGTFRADIAGSHTDYSQWQALGWDKDSKTGEPLFVNLSAGDFRLQPNSPACGMGAFPCSAGP